MPRIGLDATPLLGRRTGIGRYVEALVSDFAATDRVDAVATAFSRAPVEPAVPKGMPVRQRRVPARLLHKAWTRGDFPPVEFLTGRLDLFHGTNFVLPPLRSARGVLSVHDLTYLRFPETVSTASARYRELVPRGLRRAAVVCALTEVVADEIADEYGFDRSRVVVAPPGVEPSWFTAQPLSAEQRAALDVPELYIVAVGTLEPRKNLPLLVKAHRQLVAEDSNAPTLVIAGQPGWGAALGVRSSDRVVLTGYLGAATLQGLVAGARLLAFPSIYEGFGLPPLEAFACGVPVVVSDLPATREVLGPLAAYVPVGDCDALAEQLRLTLADTASGMASGTARDTSESRRAHATTWTWDRCVESVLAAYDLALA